MGLKDIVNTIFGTKTADPARREIKIDGTTYVPAAANVELQKIALQLCKDYIASAVGKCELRTFLRGKEVFGDEYYLWNISPNPNQTPTEFWREVIFRLYEDTEALIVPINDKLMIAESFSVEEQAIKPKIFTGITRGTLTLNRRYDSTTAIYLSLPEDMRPETLLSGVTSLLNRTLKEAEEKYRMEGGERGVLEYDAMRMGDEEYSSIVQDMIDKDFAAYFSSRNAVVPMYEGTKYTPVVNNAGQKTSIVGDINSLLEESVKVVAQAMKIPPVLILGTVADTKAAVQNFLTFCIDPLMDMITESINAVRYGKEVLKGSYISADTGGIEHIDPLSVAEKLDKLRAASIYNTNELRRRIGEPRINEKWADEYALTKNYEAVSAEEEKKGDEANANDKEDDSVNADDA